MEKKLRSEITAAERKEIFHEQYGNEIDAGLTLAEIVRAAGDYLGRIVGRTSADAGMARMIEPVATTAGRVMRDPSEWRDALNDARFYCYSEWDLGARLHDLAAYAIYGIVLSDSDDEQALASHIEEMLNDAQHFLDSTPVAQWKIAVDADLCWLVRLANNRWALDNGRPVEPAALAYLGGVSEGHIRNMMSKRTFTAEEGGIPAQQALNWLNSRENFWTSLWREQRVPQYGAKRQPPMTQPMFVPVARDDTAFHPGLRRGQHYTIGEKGAEVQIADFYEALAQLQRMPVAYWRRPNAHGNWGIVAGVRWQRLDASDLEVLARNPSHRIPQAA